MNDSGKDTGHEAPYGLRNKAGLCIAPLVLLFFIFSSPPDELSIAAWRTAGVALTMATLWISEAIAIPATAMLPLVLFPLLGINDMTKAAAPYAHKLIFLLLGGFLLALAMQQWNLHKRIALHIVNKVGTSPRRIIGGFMIAAAFLSMWVSNTATTMMMLPISLSVILLLEQSARNDPDVSEKDSKHFTVCLILAIAYSANVGGVGTIIGTAPNGFMQGFLADTYGYDMTFADWMKFGVPFTIIMLVIIYYMLTHVLFHFEADHKIKGVEKLILSELGAMGKMTRGELMTAIVGGLMAFFWIFGKQLNIPGLSDPVVAIAGGLLLFIVPVDLKKGIFTLDWRETSKLPWGIIILIGGGLSLSDSIRSTGLSSYIGSFAGQLEGIPPFALAALTALMIVFLTEVTSNTATTTTFLPILGAVAVQMGLDPLMLVIPATVAASCAFMLPVATPPNAVVFGSGRITLPQMAKAGFALNIATFIVIPVLLFTLGKLIFPI